MAGSTPAAPAVTGRSKELDALLACFFDLSADLLAVAGRDGCLQSVNPAWAAVLGFSEEDLLGRRWIDLVHPAAAAVSQAPLAAGPLYPSLTQPPSVHQIIEISDPPRVVQPSSPPEVHPTSTPPSGEATPRATAAPTPSPGSTPCPDGCQGGGGGDN